jgi:predicted RND superfamily exporter protein
MDKFYAFLNKLFLLLGLIGFIVAIIEKFGAFGVMGLFPMSYLRFSGMCLLFVIAISLYQQTAKKQPQKKRKR